MPSGEVSGEASEGGELTPPCAPRERRTKNGRVAIVRGVRGSRRARRRGSARPGEPRAATPSVVAVLHDVPAGKVAMRALSVRQPWAELIARGRKKVECRSWSRDFRGDLLIVASASRHDDVCRDERIDPDAP